MTTSDYLQDAVNEVKLAVSLCTGIDLEVKKALPEVFKDDSEYTVETNDGEFSVLDIFNEGIDALDNAYQILKAMEALLKNDTGVNALNEISEGTANLEKQITYINNLFDVERKDLE